MHKAIISLGSNIPEGCTILDCAMKIMRLWFNEITFSDRLQNPAVNMEKPANDFINQLALVETTMEPKEIIALCKRLEIILGNSREQRDKAVIVIDADLVEYDCLMVKQKDASRNYYIKLKDSLTGGTKTKTKTKTKAPNYKLLTLNF